MKERTFDDLLVDIRKAKSRSDATIEPITHFICLRHNWIGVEPFCKECVAANVLKKLTGQIWEGQFVEELNELTPEAFQQDAESMRADPVVRPVFIAPGLAEYDNWLKDPTKPMPRFAPTISDGVALNSIEHPITTSIIPPEELNPNALELLCGNCKAPNVTHAIVCEKCGEYLGRN